METQSVAELEQHVSLLEDRIRQVKVEIRALLVEDLPRFLERELKRMFVSHPDFASSVSDDELRAIKADLAEHGEQLAAAVGTALEDDSLWLVPSEGQDDTRKAISENATLWAAVSEPAVTALSALLSDNGFPASEQPLEYRAPTWFIGRRYLPSLSEKYWRHLREWAEAGAQIHAIESEASKSALTRRWDAT